jgi:hypothetical protein
MALTQTHKALLGGTLVAAVGVGGYVAYKDGLFGPRGLTGKAANPYTGPSANAAGDTVSLQAPAAVAAGQPITVTATARGFTNPVYQFWFGKPGAVGTPGSTSTTAGYGWQGTSYEATDTATFMPNEPGNWAVIVYAREATAPPNETKAQRSQYEAASGGFLVAVA